MNVFDEDQQRAALDGLRNKPYDQARQLLQSMVNGAYYQGAFDANMQRDSAEGATEELEAHTRATVLERFKRVERQEAAQ